MTKNNNFIEEVEREFDNFMINEYGQWKIGRVEAKQFISKKLQEAQLKAREELKKEIVVVIDNELMPDDEYNGCWITMDKDNLIDKIKSL